MWTEKIFHCVYMKVSKKQQRTLSPNFTFSSITFMLISSYPV